MPFIYRSMFAINDINNGILKSTKAMPNKDITSDGTNNFAINRCKYSQTTPLVSPTILQAGHKKWYGGTKNKDASDIVNKNKLNQIGVGSFNPYNQRISFTTNHNFQCDPIQKKYDALQRTRSGGYVTTPKIRNSTNKLNNVISHRPIYGNTIPRLIRTDNHSVIYNNGKGGKPFYYDPLF
jgi:hypothetical protein